MLLLTIFVAIYFGVLVPESPKWNYGQKMFQQAREILVYVANFNRMPPQKSERISNSKFDIEIIEQNGMEMDAISIKTSIS